MAASWIPPVTASWITPVAASGGAVWEAGRLAVVRGAEEAGAEKEG